MSGPPGVDGPAEVKLLQDLGRTAVDGIAVENLAPELFVRPMTDLAVDTAPLEGSAVTTYVGNDNEAIGRALAEEAIRLLPADATGTVVIGTTVPGVPVLDHRADGIKAAFADKLDSYNLGKNEATLRAVKEGVNFADAATDGRPLPEGWVDSGALLVTQADVAEVIARQESGEARDKWFAPRLDEFFADLGAHTRPLGEAS